MSQDKSTKKFMFGVVVRKADSGKAWAERARLVEQSGFTTLLMPDHFVGPRFAPIAALSAAAAATSTLRIGTLVFSNDYRHPVVLGKELATLDVLSDGRLDVGLGTGWMREDYDRAGLSFDPPKVRFDRFVESLEVLRGVWGQGALSYQGQYYQIDELVQEPKPVQKPYPKFLFPGGGPKMLKLAGRYADYVNLTLRVRADGTAPDAKDGGLESFLGKIETIRESAGARFDDIAIGTSIQEVGIPQSKESWSAVDLSQQEETPQILRGDVSEMVDKLRYWRDTHGLNFFVLHNDKDLETFIPVVEKLAGE
ncbi:coenzyme F420-dependent N5 N10-methylene tetrahydromethanopterin reductase-like protein [Rhodococcus opacus M213]|uniref:Coenzyme F420-dependent N5 N10-methylene tetrahydromethanopterin reductase-like protein n=1 Tax=Rhodococcus opacus M213 TaxID=1129896 RepID=K8XE69_RHOOP|nr:TIGR03621 family F420-dependent LLM class oxidoreductase [Rhodococcus opacus]EKT79694.1 coenzyme F420-dependent N5 N10-methylene tetrahydromethanopterin reductase-like protein [Rhodococcus opacus M213]